MVHRAELGGGRDKASKEKLLKLLDITCRSLLTLDGYYAPNSRIFRLSMLKDVLSGHRKLVKKAEMIPLIGFERFEELTLQRLIQYGRENIPDFMSYLPEEPFTMGQLDRVYIMNVRHELLQVMNSVRPHCIEELRLAAINRSNGINQEAAEQRVIVLTEELRNIFNSNIYPLSKI